MTDHEMETMREYPLRFTSYTRDGTEIRSTVYPHHEAKVIRAKAKEAK